MQKQVILTIIFFRYGFSIIWAIFMLKQLILYVKLFSQIQKNFFFYNPHHSDKKRRTIAEFSTDFEIFFTFVIRITFLTNRGVPRRIRERDLFYPSYSTPLKIKMEQKAKHKFKELKVKLSQTLMRRNLPTYIYDYKQW